MPLESEAVSGPVVVLLVDDEIQVLNLLRHCLLKQQVYQVLTASSGEEALAFSRNSCTRLDIVVTDIDMGKMSGIDLYQHLRRERPETAVLFMSGTSGRFREALPPGRLLTKPFSLQDFVSTVAEEVLKQKSKLWESCIDDTPERRATGWRPQQQAANPPTALTSSYPAQPPLPWLP